MLLKRGIPFAKNSWHPWRLTRLASGLTRAAVTGLVLTLSLTACSSDEDKQVSLQPEAGAGGDGILRAGAGGSGAPTAGTAETSPSGLKNGPCFEAQGAECGDACTDGIDNDGDGRIDGYDVSCSPPVCNENDWCWQHPRPHGFAQNDAMAFAADDHWVVGADGYVGHWDGTGWRVLESGTRPP